MERQPSTITKIAVSLVGCVLGVVLCGTSLELVLRWGLIPNPEYARRHVQGAHGQVHAKPLILGDSFIVQETLLAQLFVQTLQSSQVAVLNAAANGAGPFQYVEQLQTMAAHFHPDLVLVSYYVGNDLTDVQRKLKSSADGRPGTRAGRAPHTRRLSLRQLYLYQYLRPRLHVSATKLWDYADMEASGIAPDLIAEAQQLTINPWLVRAGLSHKHYLLDNLLMETEDNRAAWEQTRALLADIHARCQRAGAQLLIVIFPHTLQVNASHVEFFRRLTFHLDERVLVSVKPQTLLLEFCAARQIPCLDLLPVFKMHQQEELYQAKDDHLNVHGTQLAAEVLHAFLRHHIGRGE